MDADVIASACLKEWSGLESRGSLKFLKDGIYTILAGIVLSNDSNEVECISLGSGTKCLAQSHLVKLQGEVLHDSHAEVIARRGAVLWLAREMLRIKSDEAQSSRWLERREAQRFGIREGVKVSLYVSTLPCSSNRLSTHISFTKLKGKS